MSFRVLFLDDSLERQKTFSRKTIGWNVVIVSTFEACIDALRTNPPFDCVFLDHDLSEEAAAGQPRSNEKTGTDVARFIADMPEHQRPKEAIVHSLNKSGRERIVAILRDAGIPTRDAPGAWAQIVRNV